MRSKFDEVSEHSRSSMEDTDREVVEEEVEGEEEEVQNGNYIEETPPESPVELAPELPPYYPALQGCRSVEEFHCLNRIEEGTYGVVYRARDKKIGEL